jgi:hypothetical protein
MISKEEIEVHAEQIANECQALHSLNEAELNAVFDATIRNLRDASGVIGTGMIGERNHGNPLVMEGALTFTRDIEAGTKILLKVKSETGDNSYFSIKAMEIPARRQRWKPRT